MSGHDDNLDTKPPESTEDSVTNPFTEDADHEEEKPQLKISPSRAAVFGLGFGVVMVGLLVVCFLLTALLATCTGG